MHYYFFFASALKYCLSTCIHQSAHDKTHKNPRTLKWKSRISSTSYTLNNYLPYVCRLYRYYNITYYYYYIRTEWHWAPRRNKYTCLSLLRVASYYHNRFMHMNNIHTYYTCTSACNTCSVHMRLARCRHRHRRRGVTGISLKI